MNFLKRVSKKKKTVSPMDPLNPEYLPIEIHDVILDYLSVPDLLSASLVSKLWYQQIGSSASFKRKVSLNIHSWDSFMVKDHGVIAKSERCFEQFSIRTFKRPSGNIMASFKYKNWNKVTVNISQVESQRHLLKFMMPFVTSVKYLKMMNILIGELNTSEKIQLPALEHLVMSDITLDTFNLFITNFPFLKTVCLRYITADILSPETVAEALIAFLDSNEHIKELELHYDVTNNLFILPSELCLKLKALTVGLDAISDNVRTNLESFIKFQGVTIERFKMICHQKFERKLQNQWNNEWDELVELGGRHHPNRGHTVMPINEILMIYNIWNDLSGMKFFAIRFLKDLQSADIDYELVRTIRVNTNITSFYVQFMNCNIDLNMLLPLIKCSPGIETLYITKLTKVVVQFAALNLRALRKLRCFSMENGCQQEYNTMKAERRDINNFIDIIDRCAYG